MAAGLLDIEFVAGGLGEDSKRVVDWRWEGGGIGSGDCTVVS